MSSPWSEEEIEKAIAEDEAEGRRRDRLPEVMVRAEKIRVDREARRLVDEEDAERSLRVAPAAMTLADDLRAVEPPMPYSVAQLHPRGANSLLAARFKAGKTTLLANLMRCLVDGEPFLGEHEIDRAPGRVSFWNYEVSGRQFRSWLRSIGIAHQDDACTWNLRGYRLPLTTKAGEDAAVAWLEKRNVGTLILDPYARAYGGEENNNTEVGRFVEALDVVKERAGVVDLFISAHTGRAPQEEGAERVRGATRLDDWADVRWMLSVDNDDRYLSAHGRDVAVPERTLGFEPSSRRLTVVGGSRRDERRQRQQHELMVSVVHVCDDEPGIGSAELRKRLSGKNKERDDAIRGARNGGWIAVRAEGQKQGHYATDQGRQAAGRGQGSAGDAAESPKREGTA